MEPLSSFLYAVAAVTVWYVVTSFASWYRLRQVPGPLLGSFSYLWMAWKVFRGRGGEYEQLRKYGSLVRIGPNYILTDDPKVVRQINGARSLADKDEWYLGAKFDPKQDSMFTMLEHVRHDKMKARAIHAYNGRDNIDMEGRTDALILHLVDVIRKNHLSTSSGTKPIDFAQFIRYFTLDIITDVGFGKAFGWLDAQEDLYGYSRSAEEIGSLIAIGADVPILRRIFTSPITAMFFAPKPTDKRGIGKVLGLGYEIVHDRFQKKNLEAKDMIGAFMRQGLNQKEVETETLIQIFAGSDTTATAIRSTMLHVASTPRVYKRLKAEILEAVRSGKASHPITNEESKKLPYLQAVIHEGLRMRPPQTYGAYKKLPPGGETIDGIFIPGGTSVGWNGPAMMRREDIFGSDPQTFRPERFVECDEAKKQDMMRTVELVFGYGRWMCAGKALAIIELNKIYFELMRAFDWQVINPGKPWDEVAYTMWIQKNLLMRITEAEDEM